MKSFDEVVRFHGHSCPGLAMGEMEVLPLLGDSICHAGLSGIFLFFSEGFPTSGNDRITTTADKLERRCDGSL